MVARLTARFEAQLATAMDGLRGQMVGQVGEALSEYDAALQRRLRAMDAKADATAERVDAVAATQQSVLLRLQTIEAEMHLVRTGSAIKASDIDESWDRKEFLHVLRANAAEMVTQASVEKVLDHWFSTVGVKREDWTLEAAGRAPAKNWAITFGGPEATAARQAQRALGALKTTEGTWRRLDAKSTDDDEVALYVSGDKSPMQGRIEATLRKLQRAMQEVAPALQTRQLRREGVLSANWRRLIKVEAPDRETTNIKWNLEALAEAGVVRAEVEGAYARQAPDRAAAAVAWSS